MSHKTYDNSIQNAKQKTAKNLYQQFGTLAIKKRSAKISDSSQNFSQALQINQINQNKINMTFW